MKNVKKTTKTMKIVKPAALTIAALTIVIAALTIAALTTIAAVIAKVEIDLHA